MFAMASIIHKRMETDCYYILLISLRGVSCQNINVLYYSYVPDAKNAVLSKSRVPIKIRVS